MHADKKSGHTKLTGVVGSKGIQSLHRHDPYRICSLLFPYSREQPKQRLLAHLSAVRHAAAAADLSAYYSDVLTNKRVGKEKNSMV